MTHGGMPHGAGFAAARAAGAEIVDPRPWATPEIAQVYARFAHIGPVLPAMGYSPAQLQALRATIEAAQADVVVSGTPVDLAALLRLGKPVARVRYEFQDAERPGLEGEIDAFLKRSGLA